MEILSYSQNLEDVILWRALGHIQNGFYIDVGACDPVQDSVTKTFYDNGWSGINVEPVEQYYELLVKHRPRDTNLKVLIGASRERRDFYVLPDTGLSTQYREIAERHEDQRGYSKQVSSREVRTLTDVWQEFAAQTVHLLKIDVEGAEEEVLTGLDLEVFRPWIIICEATLPNTQELNHYKWDSILIDANYDYLYFDGLNRFYVAKEHDELAIHFSLPPNIFDEFQCSETQTFSRHNARLLETAEAEKAHLQTELAQSQTELAHLKTELVQLEAIYADEKSRAGQLDEAVAQLRNQTRALQSRLQDMGNSLSWRITAPLRAGLDFYTRLGTRAARLLAPALNFFGIERQSQMKSRQAGSRNLIGGGALKIETSVGELYKQIDTNGSTEKHIEFQSANKSPLEESEALTRRS